MKWHKATLNLPTTGKGLYPITEEIQSRIHEWHVQEGMCYLFLQHTSASLAINESYDPSARADMETFMERLIPENQGWYQHTLEGADDSPSHLRALITLPSLTIPVDNGRLSLGSWQGVYLFEHRTEPQRRRLLIRCLDAE